MFEWEKAKRKPSFDPENTTNNEDVKRTLKELLDNNNSNSDSTWLIKHSDLEFTKELGNGSSGRVFKGLYQGNKVAIKVLKTGNEEALEEFRKEFLVMSIVKSPNIVHFFGACLEPKICMVMEYCRKGNLLQILRDPKNKLDWKKGLNYMCDMMKGLEVLHTWSPAIVHRDVKTSNLLINADDQLKIADMGLARFDNPDAEKSMKRLCGTYSYLAPEVFGGESFSIRSDIFSVGIVLWEVAFKILNGNYQAPYSEFTHITADFQVAQFVAEYQLRNTIPLGCPSEYADQIRKCTSQIPSERPTTAELLKKLTELYNKINSDWFFLKNSSS